MITKIIRVCLAICLTSVFSGTQVSIAQNVHLSGENLSSAFVVFKGIQIFPGQPLKMQLILDQSLPSGNLEGLKNISQKFMQYFLTALTIPEKDLWVNLSPYESGRIIEERFGRTVMGQDLLAMDLELKRLTASLMNPDSETGAIFWRAWNEIPGSESDVSEIFSKVWIVPRSADLSVRNGRVVVVNSSLAVMTEQDLAAQIAASASPSPGVLSPDSTISRGYELFKVIVLPEIEQAVNASEVFAPLRQMYHAMILASWHKRQTAQMLAGYVDQSRVLGVESGDAQSISRIYEDYKRIFSDGSHDVIREEYDPSTMQMVPRHYFSGGFATESDLGSLADIVHTREGEAETDNILGHPVGAGFDLEVIFDAAQMVDSARSGKHPLQAVSDNPALKDFVVQLQTKRYQRWGLSGDLIARVVDELLKYPNDPEAARQAVYRNVIDFDKDDAFKAAYTTYKNATKYGSTHQVIESYLADLSEGSVVLDVGAGTNGLMRAMAVKPEYSQLKFVGTEVYDYRSSSDKEGDRTIPNLEFVSQEGVARLPFEDQSVSLMTLNFVIHHVDWKNQDAFLAELKRVLKPDGKIIFFEDTFSINLFFDDLQSDVELSRAFFELYAQDSRNAYDVISFLDWYSNIVVLGLTGMNMPFSFRSMEDWFEYFRDNGLYMTSASFHGFREDKFHNSIHGIMVLSPDKSQAVEKFTDLQSPTHRSDLDKHRNMLLGSWDLREAMGVYSRNFLKNKQESEAFSTGANDYRMSYQDKENGLIRLDIVSRMLGADPIFSITYDYFSQEVVEARGLFLDDRRVLEYFLSSYLSLEVFDEDWPLMLLARVLGVPADVPDKTRVIARQKLSYLSRVSLYEDLLHGREPMDGQDHWLPIPRKMIPHNETTYFLFKNIYKVYRDDGTRMMEYRDFVSLNANDATAFSNNDYKAIIVVDSYAQWIKNSMINALRRGMPVDEVMRVYGKSRVMSSEGFIMNSQGIFISPSLEGFAVNKAMMETGQEAAVLTDADQQTFGGVQLHSRFVNIQEEGEMAVTFPEVKENIFGNRPVLGIRPLLKSIQKIDPM